MKFVIVILLLNIAFMAKYVGTETPEVQVTQVIFTAN
jgi:hypothetical protein